MAKALSRSYANVQRYPSRGIRLPLPCLLLSKCPSQLCQMQTPYSVEGLQESIHPMVVPQYPIDDAPTGSDNLYRYPDKCVEKLPKLHAEKLIPMFPFTNQQSKPRF